MDKLLGANEVLEHLAHYTPVLRFGLQAGVFTNDARKIFKAFDEIQVGGVIINDYPTFRIDNMPYGGIKDSGFGREGVRYAIEEMTEPKLLALNLQ